MAEDRTAFDRKAGGGNNGDDDIDDDDDDDDDDNGIGSIDSKKNGEGAAAPQSLHGAQGVRSSLTALGRILGNVVGASVMQRFGAPWMYGSFGVLSLCLAGCLFFLGRGLPVFNDNGTAAAGDGRGGGGVSCEGCDGAGGCACACEDCVSGDDDLQEMGVHGMHSAEQRGGVQGSENTSARYESLEVEG